jgi:hypothetical protein
MPRDSGEASCPAIHSGLLRRSLARSSGLPAKVLRKLSRAMGLVITRNPHIVILRSPEEGSGGAKLSWQLGESAWVPRISFQLTGG